MAGVKGKSGGFRQGAGKKPLPPEEFNIPTEIKPKKTIEQAIQVMQTCDMKNLVCPIEFNTMPYAKQAWEYVLELDKNSKYHLLNDRHYESLKSYCLAVELRQNLIAEWERENKATTIKTKNGEIKINPTLTEISRQSDKVNAYAEDLGLTVLSEFEMAKKKISSPTLNDAKKEPEKKINLFQ